jgi:RecA-family ATPase
MNFIRPGFDPDPTTVKVRMAALAAEGFTAASFGLTEGRLRHHLDPCNEPELFELWKIDSISRAPLWKLLSADHKAASGPRPNGHAANNNGSAPDLPHVINPADWEGAQIPERKWIVPDYIPDASVTMLSGDGGQGKSLLGLQLAVGRALAREWIGLIPKSGRTLVLSAEDDGDEMHRRLDAVRKFHRASFADLTDIRLVDLVGEDPLLALLTKGKIEPAPMYQALETYMADFNPGLLILDVLADMFPADESIRVYVRQFINLLKRLARQQSCAVLLLAHPSLTGMNTGSGLSGSTDWNNGVRSRLYLKTPKREDGQPDIGLRTLEGMKSNYSARGGKIDLQWKDGLFVPVSDATGFDKLAADRQADEAFIKLLKRFNADNRNASEKPGTSYAPTLFAEQPDAEGITVKQFKAAMDRLLAAKRIRIEDNGTKSRPSRTFVLVDG